MKRYIYMFFMAVLMVAACKKNDYYKDSGVTDPNFNGTILDYLRSKPGQFDSVSKIVKLAGMEDVFQQQQITFFAPSDSSISATIHDINSYLAILGMQPINRMEQIDASVWRKYLSLYVFNGAKSLNDYPQVDWANFSAFGGQTYPSYNGYPMHIGVVYTDAKGIQYAGYRMLELSYISSQASPRDITTWFTIPVASANIHPTNGYVHALRYLFTITLISGSSASTSTITVPFGFNVFQLSLDAIQAGIKY